MVSPSHDLAVLEPLRDAQLAPSGLERFLQLPSARKRAKKVAETAAATAATTTGVGGGGV
jgi:hypothetical protein